MKFIETDLADAFLIEVEPSQDERGFFARSFCRREFEAHGLDPALVQCNISYNRRSGTLRGMHFQRPPFEETKVVRCTSGAIFDVIVDLRPDSRTFMRHVAVELTAENRRQLYVPKGFAHGFQTLTDDSEVFYQMSDFYVAEATAGLRWNDPLLNIRWPREVTVISPRDAAYADFQGIEDHRRLSCSAVQS
jgi:dTDP-4-dehydrorhamnose 3,5-epimerase